MKKQRKAGISLISLIITIIVIIILAAIVIFTGLNTPDSAQFAKFCQQVDNVQMAVVNKHAELKTKHAIARENRTDEQIYIEIATANDPGQYATMGTTTVTNNGSSIGDSTGIQNLQVDDVKKADLSLGMTLPDVRESNKGWYVTKDGRVFNANGYIYDGKTYFTSSIYQNGELPSSDNDQKTNAEKIKEAIQNGSNVVEGATGTGGSTGGTTGGETPSTTTYTITYKDVGDTAFTGAHESGYPTSHTVGTATTLKGATKNGYTFGGWYTTSDGSGTAVTTLGANDYSANITLYAKWTSAGGITTTVNGETVTITESNFKDHLGKIVTNYKIDGAGDGTETVTVGSNTYTVSKRYRLYWIDYKNKYGDGPETVYLKADCTRNDYTLQRDGSSSTSKIVQMNPELYKSGVTAPSNSRNNMLAVTWLLDTAKWSGLKPSENTTAIGNKVKYVVGAPSLEMMMDSYNTHYGLTGDEPVAGVPEAGTRKKLFYEFTGGSGYKVGPDDSIQYSNITTSNTVYTDSIDSMYYPGSSQCYWLASPSGAGVNGVMYVSSAFGGRVDYGSYSQTYDAFCPLVALDSDVQLTLAGM